MACASAPGDDGWQDVTALVQEAAASLGFGETISSSEYSLSEAMNALEFMDPKLDPGVSATLVPVASRLADKTLPLVALTDVDVLGIMDKLLQLEVRVPAWSEQPLAPTRCRSAS